MLTDLELLHLQIKDRIPLRYIFQFFHEWKLSLRNSSGSKSEECFWFVTFYFKAKERFFCLFEGVGMPLNPNTGRSSIGFNPISIRPIIMLIFLIIAWNTCWQNEVLLVPFQIDVGTHCCRIGAALDAAIYRPTPWVHVFLPVCSPATRYCLLAGPNHTCSS